MGFLLLQLGYNLTYELHPVVTLQIQRLSQPNMVCNHQSGISTTRIAAVRLVDVPSMGVI